MRTRITIRAPFDAHVHLREDQILQDVIAYTARNCATAVAMGNLIQPVDSFDRVNNYFNQIKAAANIAGYPRFEPIMTIMLTPNVTIETIKACSKIAKVLKLIPVGASTNSESGVPLEDIEKYYPILEEVRNQNMIFSIHAERIKDDNGKDIPEELREAAALPFVEKIIQDLPKLKIIIEHVSTKEACELVIRSPRNVAGTITAHHAFLNDSYLRPGTKSFPNFYCKPILKDDRDYQFVEKTMLNDTFDKFFFGSDSAPHPAYKKFDTVPPAAGLFSAPLAIELVTEMFDRAHNLDRLENFLSIAGREFYGLKEPKLEIIIMKDDRIEFSIPEQIGHDKIPVLLGGETTKWHVEKMI